MHFGISQPLREERTRDEIAEVLPGDGLRGRKSLHCNVPSILMRLEGALSIAVCDGLSSHLGRHFCDSGRPA